MASPSIESTTTLPAPCPHLNGQCTVIGEHGFHWGPDNQIASIRPSQTNTSLASAMLASFEDGAPPSAPRLSLSFDGFDGDLTLAEVDQLISGLRDFTTRLQIQAAHLAAAQRMHEVSQ